MSYNVRKYAPDTCPVCWFDLRKDGYPTGHQQPETGDECSYRWDVEGAMQAELIEESRTEQ